MKNWILLGALAPMALLCACQKSPSSLSAKSSLALLDITPSPSPSPSASPGTRVVLEDSFERADPINQTTGWSTFIYDSQSATPPASRKIGAAILTASQMGVAADGTRAMYFFGKTDPEVHEIYLTTAELSLADLATLNISFKYIVFGLNDPGETDEYLRFEVCNGSATDCGVGTNVAAMRTAMWKTLFQHNPALNGNSLDGTNHALTDWQSAQLGISMADYNPALPFYFRFAAKMKYGFACHKPGEAYKLLDGAAVDAVSLVGDIAQEGGEGPPQPLGIRVQAQN